MVRLQHLEKSDEKTNDDDDDNDETVVKVIPAPGFSKKLCNPLMFAKPS